METLKKATQRDIILDYIRKNGSITRLEAANNLFIFELSARISEMKKQGIKFKQERVERTNTMGITKRFTRYSLDEVAG